MNPSYDFCIIGFGPAGALAAYQLKKQGFNVALIEKRKKHSRKVCGEYLTPSGVDELHQMGLSHLCKDFLKIHGMKIVSPYGKILSCDFPIEIDAICYGYSINREQFEFELEKLLNSQGIKILWAEALQEIIDKKDSFVINSTNLSIKSKYIIAADGRNSKTARLLSLNQKINNHRIAVHCYLEEKTHDRMGEMHLFRDGAYVGLNPITEKEWNISLVCDYEKVQSLHGARQTIEYYINQSQHLKNRFKLKQEDTIYSVYPLMQKTITNVNKRVAFIGDASGFLDPLTGEGITNAIKTSHLLAQSIQVSSSIENAFKIYDQTRKKSFRPKFILNLFFQQIIRWPIICQLIAIYLDQSQFKKNAFVAIIGNIYSPFTGLQIILKGKK